MEKRNIMFETQSGKYDTWYPPACASMAGWPTQDECEKYLKEYVLQKFADAIFTFGACDGGDGNVSPHNIVDTTIHRIFGNRKKLHRSGLRAAFNNLKDSAKNWEELEWAIVVNKINSPEKAFAVHITASGKRIRLTVATILETLLIDHFTISQLANVLDDFNENYKDHGYIQGLGDPFLTLFDAREE